MAGTDALSNVECRKHDIDIRMTHNPIQHDSEETLHGDKLITCKWLQTNPWTTYYKSDADEMFRNNRTGRVLTEELFTYKISRNC